MITSSKNSQMKNISQLAKKAKVRKEQDVFIVEGMKMIEEAPREKIVKVYIMESLYVKVLDKLAGLPVEIVQDSVFREISDTVTPQGILALVKQGEYSLKSLLEQTKKPLFLLLERLQDPGNLGTIIRTAEAAGVTGIIMDKHTVDMYSPKVVRSTMGAIYRVPAVYIEDLASAITMLKKQGVVVYAAHLEGSQPFFKEDYRGGTAFLIGNEGNGLSSEITTLSDKRIHIPMSGQVESLNASVAASLLMYEGFLQRQERTKI